MESVDPTVPPRRDLAGWIRGLQARGRYSFTRDEAAETFGRPDIGLTKALGRLTRKQRIVSPRRGFYVIVPAEFAVPGAPPADWFIDDLMAYIGRPYYVGLLTAAAYHGAAHQQPQQFQVVAEVPLRPVRVGRTKVTFVKKTGIDAWPVERINTSTGTMAISTPEVTALDLVRYASTAGHLSHVATVLAELAETIDPRTLAGVVAQTGVELTVVQRLGHLLESVGRVETVAPLLSWLDEQSPRTVRLRPGCAAMDAPIDMRWRVRINATVESDL